MSTQLLYELIRDGVPYYRRESTAGDKTLTPKAGFTLFITKFRVKTSTDDSVKSIKVDGEAFHEDLGANVDHEIISDDYQGLPQAVRVNVTFTITATTAVTVDIYGVQVPKEKKYI